MIIFEINWYFLFWSKNIKSPQVTNCQCLLFDNCIHWKFTPIQGFWEKSTEMRRYKAKKADNGWKHLKAKSPMQHLVSRTMQEHNTSFECSAHNAQFTNQTRVRRLFFSQINTIETQCQFTWHSLLAKHYLMWSCSKLGKYFYTVKFSLILKE